jgi:hypothetical protein
MSLFFVNTNQFLLLPQIINKNKKNVTFSNAQYMHIIPTRKELLDENLSEDLWWSNNDYMQFRFEALNEMIELKQKHPNINREQSLKLLYQPGNICYDEANF